MPCVGRGGGEWNERPGATGAIPPACLTCGVRSAPEGGPVARSHPMWCGSMPSGGRVLVIARRRSPEVGRRVWCVGRPKSAAGGQSGVNQGAGGYARVGRCGRLGWSCREISPEDPESPAAAEGSGESSNLPSGGAVQGRGKPVLAAPEPSGRPTRRVMAATSSGVGENGKQRARVSGVLESTAGRLGTQGLRSRKGSERAAVGPSRWFGIVLLGARCGRRRT